MKFLTISSQALPSYTEGGDKFTGLNRIKPTATEALPNHGRLQLKCDGTR